ncbi:hypothetical protein PLICRDRAFT_170806 [Plicaturopsis crispa FD-325 SS-3]|nr:hypothetical protein PLICRDRAFT_170806 [Plicaturopsis crispa FD-325 SS-3]
MSRSDARQQRSSLQTALARAEHWGALANVLNRPRPTVVGRPLPEAAQPATDAGHGRSARTFVRRSRPSTQARENAQSHGEQSHTEERADAPGEGSILRDVHRDADPRDDVTDVIEDNVRVLRRTSSTLSSRTIRGATVGDDDVGVAGTVKAQRRVPTTTPPSEAWPWDRDIETDQDDTSHQEALPAINALEDISESDDESDGESIFANMTAAEIFREITGVSRDVANLSPPPRSVTSWSPTGLPSPGSSDGPLSPGPGPRRTRPFFPIPRAPAPARIDVSAVSFAFHFDDAHGTVWDDQPLSATTFVQAMLVITPHDRRERIPPSILPLPTAISLYAKTYTHAASPVGLHAGIRPRENNGTPVYRSHFAGGVYDGAGERFATSGIYLSSEWRRAGVDGALWTRVCWVPVPLELFGPRYGNLETRVFALDAHIWVGGAGGRGLSVLEAKTLFSVSYLRRAVEMK